MIKFTSVNKKLSLITSPTPTLIRCGGGGETAMTVSYSHFLRDWGKTTLINDFELVIMKLFSIKNKINFNFMLKINIDYLKTILQLKLLNFE